jgi:hypothetical protein
MADAALQATAVDVVARLAERLRDALRVDFARFVYDSLPAHVCERLEARTEHKRRRSDAEEAGAEAGAEGDMTRKRRRQAPSPEDELVRWERLETEVRTTRALVQAVHRVQFHFREAAQAAKVRRIQRWFRFWRRFACVNGTEDVDALAGRAVRGLLRRDGAPLVCPITQDVVPVANSFKLVGPQGAVYAYSCSDLIRYLRSTHRFECPATRNPILLPEVRRLQRRAAALHVNSGRDLVAEFRSRNDTRAESREHAHALTGLESSCTEVFDTAVRLCERLGSDSGGDEVLMRLESDVLPEWRDYVHQLMVLDCEACLAMLLNEQARVVMLADRGLDRSGFMGYLLDQVCEFLLACRARVTRPSPPPVVHPLFPPGAPSRSRNRILVRPRSAVQRRVPLTQPAPEPGRALHINHRGLFVRQASPSPPPSPPPEALLLPSSTGPLPVVRRTGAARAGSG